MQPTRHPFGSAHRAEPPLRADGRRGLFADGALVSPGGRPNHCETLRNLRRFGRGAACAAKRQRSAVSERLELGPLELRVLAVLWERGRAATVRHVLPSFPQLAYTTLMTTLDRLYRKGVLRRRRLGRAFGYEPRCSRDQLFGQWVSGQVVDVLSTCQDSTVLLSTLVQAVGHTDAQLLDELEGLVRAERARLKWEEK